MSTHPAPTSHMATDDEALRQQLHALTSSTASSDALGSRVMLQWHQLHPGPASVASTSGHADALALGGPAADRRRRWRAVSLGLLVGTVVIAAWWLQRPDPSVDELMQADVLSQMAIGEL